ncbi:hypothetical protein VTK73DRAFT_5480 [Phialemonium thermophilum]|uniref:Aminoglycoside phosphotransferase domain-containing protein n=1 Tax=Phialemonium thermophilum TaxID=223376 RepID=A0ABR3WNU6_9PEZI
MAEDVVTEEGTTMSTLSRLPRPITAAFLAKHRKLGTMPEFSRCWLVSGKLVVKTGRGVRRSEAETLHLLRRTGLPVPRVVDDYAHPETGDHVIIMEYVEGVPLDQMLDAMDGNGKRTVVTQLHHFVQTMRRDLRTSGFIGAVDSTEVKDHLFVAGRSGPFETERDFVNGLVASLEARAEGSWIRLVSVLLNRLPDHGPQFVLTHGDLNARNILVRGSQIVAVLDWGQAGYYPEHWESVKACFWDLDMDFFHKAVVEEVLQYYPLELSVMLHARDIVW